MKSSQPEVDVILPYYKGHLWVEEAIDTVLSQTYPHWRLLIVDDASPNGTLPCLRQRYQGRHGVSILRLRANRGAAGARMEAVRRTRGDMIAFIDQDDRWYPEKLEQQIARFRRGPLVQAVHTDVQHIDPDGRVIRGSADRENSYRARIQYATLESPMLMRNLFYIDSIRLVSAVVSREAFEQVGGFDETLFGSEDWEFWIRFAAAGYRIGHLAQPLVQRRLHEGNVSRRCSRERLLELLRAAEAVGGDYSCLADLIPHRKSLLLRQIIADRLLHTQGGLVRPEIGQLIALSRGWSRTIGYGFWILSFLGPLQSPLAKAALQLVRRVTSQGGSTPPNLA
jgi:glycosyltransferase involved in cell wall biosynthesis